MMALVIMKTGRRTKEIAMTANQLIEILRQYNPNVPVIMEFRSEAYPVNVANITNVPFYGEDVDGTEYEGEVVKISL